MKFVSHLCLPAF